MVNNDSLLIDVSHIVGWKGGLTGIERVEFQIIKYYFENTKAGFVVWSPEKNGFVSFSRQDVQEKIVERDSTQERADARSVGRTSTLKKISKRLAKRASRQVAAFDTENSMLVLAGLWDSKNYIDGLVELSMKTSLVHIVYDMIPIMHKGFVVDFLPPIFEAYMGRILPLCKGILAISKSTENDTITFLGGSLKPTQQIDDFRLGDNISRAKVAVKPKGIDGDFILSVGTIEARKNHLLLYYLQKKILRSGKKPIPIVLAGRKGWLTSDLQYLIEHDTETQKYLKIYDNLSDSELRWAYENCLLTVTPSFYEGWGLPIAESLAYGKVTLSSNTSSMTEIGGRSVDYFSPYSVDELEKLVAAYDNPGSLKKREKYIAENYSPVSWDEAAKQFDAKVMRMLSSL